MPPKATAPQNQVKPDVAAIRQHLELLVAPAVGKALNDGLIEIAFGRIKATQAHLFPLGDLDQAAEFAERVSKAGNHVWIGAALRKPGSPIGKRTGKAAFYGSHLAWLDDAADWAKAKTESAACPPDVVVCTGRDPAWRAQLLWRFVHPITEIDRLEALTRGIQQRLGGEDVCNADRLIRLAGTVNYPTKPGRTAAELVTLRWFNGAASTTDLELAERVYAASPRVAASPIAGARNIIGQIDIDKAIAEAAKPGRWHATVRDVVAHLVGRKAPDDMVHLICRNFTQAGYTHEETAADVQVMLDGARAKWGEDTFDRVDQPAQPESPLPLMRELPPETPFPIDALGKVLGGAARGIQDVIQAPLAMCGQSVLGTAALAVQGHCDVVLPTEQTRPTSLYLVTIAATGDRKSACDREAMWPIRRHEENLGRTFEVQMPAWKDRHDLWKAEREKILKGKATHLQKQADLAALGPEPARPLDPVLIGADPTIEGLVKLFGRGQPSIGLFSAEGGQFIGSHSMSKEVRLRTATGFSEFWDGEVFKRIRASEDTLILRGRRISVHLMAQPDVAGLMLGDPLLLAQGLLSRTLLSAPASLAGTRLWREPDPQSDIAIKACGHDLLTILEDPPATTPGKVNELAPRPVRLSPAAREEWIEFADDTERRMTAGGEYESIRGLANKLAEHAARLAVVLAVVEQPKIGEIDLVHLEAGIELARYYAGEALRLFSVTGGDPDLLLAQRLLAWLQDRSREPVPLRDMYTYGPNPIRNREDARRVVQILEDHGWLRRDQQRAEAWSLVG